MSPLRRLFALATLCASGLGAAGQFSKFSVPFEAFAAAYPQAGWLGGLAVTLISGLGVICGLFAGLLAAQLGYRRMLLWALWGGAVLSAVQILFPPLPLLMATRLLEGASHLIIVVAAPTLMAQIATDQSRPAVMTVWSTFFGVGFAGTALLGLPLVAATGLEGVLAAHVVLMVVTALALSVQPIQLKGPPAPALRLRDIANAHVTTYLSPALSAPALGWLCYTLTYVALLTVLPSSLLPEDRLWAGTWMPLAGLMTSLTLGIVLLRVMNPVQLTLSGFAMATFGALVISTTPANAVLPVALMACLGLVQSGSFAAVPQLVTQASDQALANGAMAQMGNLGNLLGTPVLLGIVAAGGPKAIYWALALAYGAGFSLHMVQLMRRRRAEQEQMS